MGMFFIKEGSDQSDAKDMSKKIQELGGIKEVLIIDKSHLGVDIIEEVKRMADDNTEDTALEVMTAENPLDQQNEPKAYSL